VSDIEIVRACLQHWRGFALGLRYAGLMEKLNETECAIEALNRIASPRFTWEPREDAPSTQDARQ